MNRRGFLGGLAGILAAGVAPAAVGSSILMPVRKVAAPAWTWRDTPPNMIHVGEPRHVLIIWERTNDLFNHVGPDQARIDFEQYISQNHDRLPNPRYR